MIKEYMGNEKKEEKGTMREGKEKGSKKNFPFHKEGKGEQVNAISIKKAKSKALESAKK
jgi:hypothetical protein